MPHWRIFYHFVWRTKGRRPMLSDAIRQRVFDCIRTTADDMGAMLCYVGGTENHVHVLVSLPPKFSAAQIAQRLKGVSSRFASQTLSEPLAWQEGYAVFTVSESGVAHLIRYIRDQRAHHAKGSTLFSMEPSLCDADVDVVGD